MTRFFFQRFATTLIIVLLFVGLRIALFPLLGGDAPLLLLVPAVMLAAWCGGFGSGLVATGSAVVLSSYLLLPPYAAWAISRTSDWLRLLMFVLIGVSVSSIVDLLRRSRQQAEVALAQTQASERHLRNVLDNLFAFVGVLTPDGTLVEINRAPLEAAGITAEAVIGKKFWDCYWWNYDAGVQEKVRDAVHRASQGASSRFDVNVRMAGGETITIDFMLAPMRDETGRLTHLIPSAVPITERKQAEESLRASEELVRTIAENSTQGLAMMDARGYCTYANRAWLEMTGYTAEEIGAKPLHDLVHHHYPDGRPFPKDECPIDRALPENFDIRAHEDVFFRKDGSTFPVFCAASPVFKDGKPVSTVVEIRDVTEAKAAEAELREGEARFRALADNIAQLAWMADAKGNVFWYNRRWFEYTGTTFEEMDGWEWRKIHHPDFMERVIEKFFSHIQAGEAWEDTFPLRGRDGNYRWFLSRAIPIRDESGRVWRWFGTNTDITEQKDLLEALDRENRRKDEFLAMLAHELRNPLAPIIHATQVLRLRAPADPNLHRQQEIIERQSTQLARLLDDLLDVARITRGHVSLRREPLNLPELLAQTVEASRPLFDKKQHHLELSLPEDPVLIEGDPVRLTQVFTNLLNNAANYTPPGGKIWVELEAQNRPMVEIRVRDTGIGIPRATLPYIFDLFSQGERDLARSEGGLGIGLTTVRALVEMHDGRVEAHSEGPGMGSEFVVHLPALRTLPNPAEPPAPNSAPPTAPAFRRVLVVDDNQDAAETIMDLLELWGHDCRMANGGEAGLQLAREYLPDTVLLDLGMPGLDGYMVARCLRQDPQLRQVELIALTGYGQPEDRRRTAEAGFDYHLTKPVDAEKLRKLLAHPPSPRQEGAEDRMGDARPT